MEPVFDHGAWPLLTVTFGGPMQDDEFDRYIAGWNSVLARPSGYAVIMDARAGGIPTLSQQRKQARWMNDNRKVIEQKNRGTAFVIESGALRFALSAIFSIARMPGTYTVVPTVEEARAWCTARLNDKRPTEKSA